ncbi:MAG: hypothetical protein SFW36_05480 [Leptolyngbyaceae cyanobacterium bins.59]|nr:hypothetical protein [Leptolyngbyaceae cyanobacterium bins.59]
MNPQDDQELERRLRQLESEVNPPSNSSVSHSRKSTPTNSLGAFWKWYGELSRSGQMIVIAIGVLGGLAIVSAVLRLVMFTIQLAFLAGLLYIIYRLFFNSRRSGR